MRTVLVVSAEQEVCRKVAAALGANYSIERSGSQPAALQNLAEGHHDMVFIDTELLCGPADSATLEGQQPLQPFLDAYPSVELILLVPQERIRQAAKLLKSGATDYVLYPLAAEEIRSVAESVEANIIKNLELDYLRDHFWQTDTLEIVRTENAAMRRVYEKIRSVAQTKATVLLVGETGTGKGIMARLIHLHSHRREAQFISVHCGAIPETLLESELFGHEKGAFTGAHRRKRGKFDLARGGTIFLDEVGTIPSSSQIKLLQVLQDGTFSPVGAETIFEADVRIIAATNANLSRMCEEGSFRKDLYYRLNVFPIELPALRERIEDIPYLVDTLLKKLNKEYGKQIQRVHPAVISALKRYPWPGNIRELENLLERAYLLESTKSLTPEVFPEEIFKGSSAEAGLMLPDNLPLTESRKKVVENFERRYLKALLTRNRGKINDSAAEAGITPRQLNKLMGKYAIRKEAFKSP